MGPKKKGGEARALMEESRNPATNTVSHQEPGLHGAPLGPEQRKISFLPQSLASEEKLNPETAWGSQRPAAGWESKDEDPTPHL